MAKQMLAVFICSMVIILVASCSTKNDYHYNVVDCKEPQIAALGDYILSKIQKNQRDIMRGSTCYADTMQFLRAAPFVSVDKSFDARRLAAVWVYKYRNENDAVFGGVEETLKALTEGTTWNILVDKKFSVHRYILRNSTDGAISVAYLSQEQLMGKVTNELWWSHLDVIECQNFMFYLAKEFGNNMISFTVVDKENSNDELRMITYSNGICGFYKTSNDGKKE